MTYSNGAQRMTGTLRCVETQIIIQSKQIIIIIGKWQQQQERQAKDKKQVSITLIPIYVDWW